jgi:hypothetical protein
MSKQEQRSGDNSTNIQAQSIVVTHGLSLAEARQVAMDVFRANFYELAGKARDTARSRGEHITERIFAKLQDENPAGIAKAEDPDFQNALFTVQKEFARSGDEDLGELLVDLLVDRSKREHRDILQIVLNESLNTAPKLTNDQLAVLAVMFFFRYTQNLSVGTLTKLAEHLDRHISPFTRNLNRNDSCYQHLEFTGCGSVSLGQIRLETIFAQIYKGLFVIGFDKNEIESRGIAADSPFIVPCLNDPNKLQVRAINKDGLQQSLTKQNVDDQLSGKLLTLFDAQGHSEPQIREKIVGLRPYMAEVFDAWDESPMRSFNLTSVGIAIGHANIKRIVGEFSNLSIWIN